MSVRRSELEGRVNGLGVIGMTEDPSVSVSVTGSRISGKQTGILVASASAEIGGCYKLHRDP